MPESEPHYATKPPPRVIASILRSHRRRVSRLAVLIGLTAAADGLVVWLVLPLLTLLSSSNLKQQAHLSAAAGVLSFVNDAVSPRGLAALLFAGLLTACGLKMVFQVLRRRSAAQLQWHVRHVWMRQLMSRYLYADYQSLADRHLGKLLDSLIVETRQAALCLFELVECAGKCAQLACLLCVLMFVNAPVAIVSAVAMAFAVVGLLPLWQRLVVPLGQQHVALNQECKGIAAENVSLFADIKAFGIEERRLATFDQRTRKLADIMVLQATLHSIPQPLGELLLVAGLLLAFVGSRVFGIEAAAMIPLFGFGLVVLRRSLSLGTAVAAHAVTIGGTSAALGHVHKLIEADNVDEHATAGRVLPKQPGEIVFRGLSFAYPGQPAALSNVDLALAPLSVTVVVGPSGSGKSTLAHLLLGFLRPTSGSILVDGRQLDEFDIREWRQQIGYVSQDPVLFNTSIVENIAVGDPKADMSRIREACRLAGAEEFICRLPEGFETIVGERGVRLSAGERQRLAVARAVVRDPQILIFDEVTSALDPDSARLIEQTVETLRRAKTILFITHRTTSLKFADRVVRVQSGSIFADPREPTEATPETGDPALLNVA